jgi:hypothetical protein
MPNLDKNLSAPHLLRNKSQQRAGLADARRTDGNNFGAAPRLVHGGSLIGR